MGLSQEGPTKDEHIWDFTAAWWRAGGGDETQQATNGGNKAT